MSCSCLCAFRAVITAEDLYCEVRFQCWVLKLTDGTHVALSRDFPETVGHCKRAKSALKELTVNAQSTLVTAMRRGAVYRQPTHSGDLTVEGVASLLDEEIAGMVVSIDPATFVVFPM
jgi:hypothetical protein